MSYPRYVTYTDEQLRDLIGQIDPGGTKGITIEQLRHSGGPGRGRLIKEHVCSVTFPDGATGTCRYLRCGPNWHQFRYVHGGRESIVPITKCSLPVYHFTSVMENTPDGIAAKAQELTVQVYEEAIKAELRDHFRRSLPPCQRKVDAHLCQMTAKRAKEIAGKYALCLRLGEKLVPCHSPFGTMEEANQAWRDKSDNRFFVACACRWSRRWEMPLFNPLYREMDINTHSDTDKIY